LRYVYISQFVLCTTGLRLTNLEVVVPLGLQASCTSLQLPPPQSCTFILFVLHKCSMLVVCRDEMAESPMVVKVALWCLSPVAKREFLYTNMLNSPFAPLLM